MEQTEQEKFWKIRAEKYNNLDWVNDSPYLKAFITSTDFGEEDMVLDVGTGTGAIAHALAPLVKEVIGLDISQDMLDHSNWKDNKYFIKGDIRKKIFHDGLFDKVTARMVFHHVMDDTQGGMDECYRVLKLGGKLVIAEGVPPTAAVKQDYVEIFKLKEHRLTFLEEDLVKLMENSGFKNIKVVPHILSSFSVRNWLENSGLDKEIQEKIVSMHMDGSDVFKKAYNLKVEGDDCLIDVKNVIIIGEK